ncbi:MAG TPA: thioredoxin domain-containing protein [Candidatus Acidoferrales bacterium]|jgi:protein-disulfide isomerase|nr:thioredoxin domain-containing protein [Candidatus Acidoferrales bacterium]
MSATASAKLKPPVGANDHIEGPAKAPVTLLEYGDYECPYCGEAYPIVKALQERLGDQVRLVFRNFPLAEAHPHAEHAAEAAEAAAAQGKFWEMHDLLYENQDALEDQDLVQYAEALKLDVPRFVKEMKAGAHLERVRADFSSGVRSGVNGTPTFFINGARHDGPFDLRSLLAAIEEAA